MPSITNIVVLMLENRSYDNVLGALYLGKTPPPGQSGLDGLTGNETNPNPNGGTIYVHATTEPVTLGGTGPAYPPTCLPIVDPGEPFDDMAQQFLSLADLPTSNPYTSYDPSASGLMQGFTKNYNAQLAPDQQSTNVCDIMNYLTPEQLPVTAFLAKNFAVCDQWFASVPSHTFTNRTFAVLAAPAVEKPLLGDPYSYIDDPQYIGFGGKRIPSTSIYEKLDSVLGTDGSPNWRVYFHDYPITLLADTYAADIAVSSTNQNVATFDTTDYGGKKPFFLGNLPSGTFVTDVVSGLPKFSFIEPRYNTQSSLLSGAAGDLLPNCDHPGLGSISIPGISSSGGAIDMPTDATSGELLLMQVYNLLQQSPNWQTTLLIVTFDEPGGTYDHVPPPLATRPGSQFPNASDLGDPAADGFAWNVFGGRVPAILISPMIEAGSTIRASVPFDHTSIIATVWDAFNFPKGSLTARDAAAPSLAPFCDATNGTGAFSGTIVCAPSGLVFTATGAAIFSASAGTNELSATIDDPPSWLTTFTPSWSPSTNQLSVVIGVDATGVAGIVQASFTVSGSGLDSVAVTVTLSP